MYREVCIKLLDSAMLVTAITGFFYSASTAYAHGLFFILHLDSDVLDRNFHQIIYSGMILSIFILFFAPFVLALLRTTYSWYVIALSNYIREGIGKGRKVVNLKKKLSMRTRKRTPIEERYFIILKPYWLVAFGIMVFIFLMVIFERQGRTAAQITLDSIESNTYNIVKFKDDGVVETLAFLYCGARNCAGMDVKTKGIRYFPQSGHYYKQVEKVSPLSP